MYWVHMTNDIEHAVTNCTVCLLFQQTQTKDKIIPHNAPGKQWEKIGADISQINSKNFLCIIDCFSKLPIIKCTQ